jgi:hypothetical protein
VNDVKGYTEEDVQLVATLFHADMCGCTAWDAADLKASSESRTFAERVLDALGEAGKLMPDGTREHLVEVARLSRRLNRPMLKRLREGAADGTQEGRRLAVYPGEARQLVALIDALWAADPWSPQEQP